MKSHDEKQAERQLNIIATAFEAAISIGPYWWVRGPQWWRELRVAYRKRRGRPWGPGAF